MLAITTIGGRIDRWDNGRPAHREQVRLMEALKFERSSRYLCSEAFITFISKPHDDDGSNSCALQGLSEQLHQTLRQLTASSLSTISMCPRTTTEPNFDNAIKKTRIDSPRAPVQNSLRLLVAWPSMRRCSYRGFSPGELARCAGTDPSLLRGPDRPRSIVSERRPAGYPARLGRGPPLK